MPHYFCSDVHLRADRPDQGERFARFVRQLAPTDALVIGGDLCDFWLACRESPKACPGLHALSQFTSRGGDLTVLVGNHDLWLGAYYRDGLSAQVEREPLEITVYGVRVHLVHGHRVKPGFRWKRLLESRTFSQLFSVLPRFLAKLLDRLQYNANRAARGTRNNRHTQQYRQYVGQRLGEADLFLFGHVHEAVDESFESARLIVLGDWQDCSSYVRIDEEGVSFRRT